MEASRFGAYVDESIHDDHGLYVLAGRDHLTTGLDAVLAACQREPG